MSFSAIPSKERQFQLKCRRLDKARESVPLQRAEERIQIINRHLYTNISAAVEKNVTANRIQHVAVAEILMRFICVSYH